MPYVKYSYSMFFLNNMDMIYSKMQNFFLLSGYSPFIFGGIIYISASKGDVDMSTSQFPYLIGERLNDIIQYKQISIRELSSASRVSKAQIYRILSNSCDTRIETLFKLLNSLSISLYNFFNFMIPIECLFSEVLTSDVSAVLKLLATNLKIQQSNLSRIKALTQSKLADNLGQSDYKYISYLFNGRNNHYINMKVSTLYKLAKELGLEKEIYLLFK